MRAATAVLLPLLAGCAGGLTGLGGSPHYACQAPKGVVCTSVSGVYANSAAGPRQPVASGTPAVPVPAYGATPLPPGAAAAPAAPDSLRTPPRVLRLWIAPWEDSDGDLHEESYLLVLMDRGAWQLARVRPPRAAAEPRGVAPPPPQAAPAPQTPARPAAAGH